MTNLQGLRLNNNQLSHVSPLASLTNLKELGLYNNHVYARHAILRYPPRVVGPQNHNPFDQDDADARHLLGPLLDDLSDGGPSTNRRGYVTET